MHLKITDIFYGQHNKRNFFLTDSDFFRAY